MSLSDCESAEEQEVLDSRLRQHWARKVRRRSSDGKSFLGDSLDLKEHQKVCSYLVKNAEKTVMLSDLVTKVNRKGRVKENWLMITDGALYTLEPGSAKLYHRIPLANISHISSSLLPDNFVIVHVPSEHDYLFNSGRKTELITVLRIAYFDAMREELSISLQNTIDYRVDKDQHRQLVFQEKEDGIYTQLFAKRTK